MVKKRCLKSSKRGSLQLSINAIVILILAITMLGLGLSFIKGIFGGTVSKLKGIEKQLAEEERKTLSESYNEVTFLQTRIEIEGKSKSFNFAVRNNRAYDVNYLILGTDPVTGDSTMRCFDALGKEAKIKLLADPSLINFETYETRFVDAGKSDIIPLKMNIKAAADPSIYSCEFSLYIESAEAEPAAAGTLYSKKRFEIEYKKG